MSVRPAAGRGLFYTRDSEGHSELAPPQYVAWARREAARLGVGLEGTPEAMAEMIAQGISSRGDLFVDYGVSGNILSRPGFDALRDRAMRDAGVSHLFVPRRDRIARPHSAVDGFRLEEELRSAGLTIVLMDGRVLPPLQRGQRIDMADLLTAIIDYDGAGKFRRDLAEKLIHAKVRLAEAGYSIGGEPPYGFRRWLAGPDGSRKRQLEEGEVVKMAGHHVVWLPTAEDELRVVERILDLIETIPANRIARDLSAEGIPSPKAGRLRRRKGVVVANSGVWTQNTVRNIATHPLLIALCSAGRRSSGDQLRLTPSGPRPLADADYRPDGRPKAVANPEPNVILAKADFEPLLTTERRRSILDVIEKRGRHLKGKARTRGDRPNALGGRLVDLNCGWTMYRHQRRERWGYICGLNQNSHSKACAHNAVCGEAATRLVLSSIRQRVLSPSIRAKLRARIEQLAAAESGGDAESARRESLRGELATVERKLQTVGRNLALVDTAEERGAVSAVFGELSAAADRLRRQLAELDSAPAAADPALEVEAALAGLGRLDELADASAGDPASAAELIARVDARLYLRFGATSLGSRTISVPVGGMLTFGSTPPPGPLYDGPTSRAIVAKRLAAGEPVSAGLGGVPSGQNGSGAEAGWSANVQRGTSRCSGPPPRAALRASIIVSGPWWGPLRFVVRRLGGRCG